MATNNKKPTHTLRGGNIKAMIKQNVSEKGLFFATTISRPFRLVPYPYLLLLLLSGCHYSLMDLRALPPTKTLDANADYAVLATCTKQRYDGAHLDKLLLWQDPGVAIARLGYWERRAFFFLDIDRAWFEIRFVRTGSAQTRIDIRNSPTEKLPLDPMLRAVNGCIESLTPPSPS